MGGRACHKYGMDAKWMHAVRMKGLHPGCLRAGIAPPYKDGITP